MILESLHKLYDRLEVDPSYGMPPRGFSLQKISFKVLLHPDGRLANIEDARQLQNGRLRPRQVRVLGVTKSSGKALNPCWLWDNSAYLLGFDPEGKDVERAMRSFEAFRAQHLAERAKVESRAFDAVCAFLAVWRPEQAASFPDLAEIAKTGFGLFQLVGESSWVHEDPKILAWWEGRLAAEADSEVRGQCLLTGAHDVPLARLHQKVKGIARGQGAGAPLVGFNAEVFESYGREKSFNAPVSEDATFRYGSALNAILDGPQKAKHRGTLGDMTLAFWTGRPTVTEDVFARFAWERDPKPGEEETQDEATRQKLELFVRALREGRPAFAELDEDPAATPYYLLGLSPNVGRVAVRLFLSSSLTDLLENLRRHYRDIGLEPAPPSGKRRGDPEFPPIGLLLRQTAREAKDVPPILEGPLLRAVLTGAPYPSGLFAAVLRRIRADRTIDYLRACVLKGYLQRNLNQEVSMSLDSGRSDPAYRLGRLFAALEKTQQDALGASLNSTIRDSFYGSASATPATVFPRLLRLYRHHSAKLEPGRRINRERLVQEIIEPLTGFATQLGLADQGLFAIGYYHQTRDFYKRRPDADVTDSQQEETSA